MELYYTLNVMFLCKVNLDSILRSTVPTLIRYLRLVSALSTRHQLDFHSVYEKSSIYTLCFNFKFRMQSRIRNSVPCE
jgi:hypothetical protein